MLSENKKNPPYLCMVWPGPQLLFHHKWQQMALRPIKEYWCHTSCLSVSVTVCPISMTRTLCCLTCSSPASKIGAAFITWIKVIVEFTFHKLILKYCKLCPSVHENWMIDADIYQLWGSHINYVFYIISVILMETRNMHISVSCVVLTGAGQQLDLETMFPVRCTNFTAFFVNSVT